MPSVGGVGILKGAFIGPGTAAAVNLGILAREVIHGALDRPHFGEQLAAWHASLAELRSVLAARLRAARHP